MSVTTSELKLYKATTMASSFSTSNIGGAISANEITGSSIGEVFFTMSANTSGGGSKVQYAKVFYKNTNSTDDLNNAVFYLANSLDDVGSNGIVSIVSDSTSDTSTKKVKVIGYDGSSNAQTEDITLNGTTTANGLLTFSAVHRVEVQLVSDGSLTTPSGNITVTRGSALGIVPAGYHTATSEVSFGIPTTLNDTATTTDASTAPGGITFAKPNDTASATAITAGSGHLTHGDAQGMWFKLNVAELASPSSEVYVITTVRGTTS